MNKITQGMIIAMVAGCFMGNVAHADNQTVSIGYAQSKVQDFKNIRGVNVQYRYEWDSPISVLGSFSYMKGDDSFYEDTSDIYSGASHVKFKDDLKYYSLLVGPAYRFNDYVSLYGLIGGSHVKIKSDNYWVDSTSTYSEHGSSNKTNFAYGAGVIINPMDNLSVNLGYEGSKVEANGNRSINGFNIGVGYRF